MHTPKTMLSRVVMIVASLILFGCGGSLRPDDFKRIEPEMSLSQVQGILGKGEELAKDDVLKLGHAVFFQISPYQVFVWKSGKCVVAVAFQEGRVVNAYADIPPHVLGIGGVSMEVSGVIPFGPPPRMR